MSTQTPAIPNGSTVLITGANGYIASNIADKFLQSGFRVRGTVRDPAKQSWLVTVLEEKYGAGKFELAAVPDITREGAFDEAVEGVSAVIHVASILQLDPDPNKVVPGVVAAALGAIKAAAREPTVKRFVFTSSASAALSPFPGNDAVIDEKSWNETAVEEACKPPPYDSSRGFVNYAASKTRAEQELWKWYQENNPSFTVNTVLPCAVFGRVLDPDNQGYRTSSGWVVNLFDGKIDDMKGFPPQWFVDVEDVGLLHVAAAVLPSVKNERIFAFAETFSYNKILAILRQLFPTRAFVQDFSEGEDLTTIKPRDRAESVLKQMGQPRWTSLEDSIKKNLESYAEA